MTYRRESHRRAAESFCYLPTDTAAAQKGKPPSRNPFSMAPLRARLEESLHKISDKLKPTKRRISEEGESGGQHSKQARTTPPSQDNTLREEFDHTFPRLQSPFRADSGGQPQPLIDLTSNAPVDTLTTKASSSTSGVSSSNPIDLTSSSPPSTPPSQRDTMEPTTPSNSQVLLDARLAMALQDEWNRETLDADRPSSHPDASHLKVDTNAMFGLVGFTSTAARYRDHLSRLRCTKCRAAISLDWGKLVSRTKNAVKTEGASPINPLICAKLLIIAGFLHSFLQCASCKMWSCAGIGCCMYQQTSPSGPGLKVSWCCDGGREFLVFALCCGPEAPRRPSITGSIPTLARCRTRLKVKSESSVPTQDTEEQPGNSAMGSVPAKSSKLQKNRAPKYTSQLSKGTGYGGSEGSHLPFNMLSSKAKTPPLSEDPELGLYFTALSLVLPSKDRERPTAFDLGPQAPLKFMISRSPVFFKALQLLRQSCMEELASEQSFNLYSQVLDFAIALTKHADLLTLLYVEAVLYPPQEHLGPLAFAPAGSQVSASSSNAEEKTKSMDSLLQNLARQCEIFVQKASTHLNEFMSPEDQAMLSRAEKVIVAANSVAALRSVVDDFPPDPDPEAAEPDPGSSSRIITRSRSAKQALNAELEKATSQSTMFHRENCALELPDEKILEGHHFAIQARAIETLTVKPARGRMKKLVTQVVSLSENLPYGIYVRYGASRMDVMKVLIVGPMDTPYQDGLFEFDLFCGADFPAKPPEMYFRTTGMGTVGFNPNLYNNGKVCLSLLGTWSGQAWEPNRSTILQVLVSIQGTSRLFFFHYQKSQPSCTL